MTESKIKVGMADLKIARAPLILTTLGLGSCVGIALYDSKAKVGGLAHIMLPDSTQIKVNNNVAKFADTAIVKLIECMQSEGALASRMVAKIAGGAHMFEFTNVDENMRIGTRNVVAVKRMLELNSIPIIAEDTGANYGRTIELDTTTGILLVKTIGHGIKEI
jgi:chemotaxis protein CheD